MQFDCLKIESVQGIAVTLSAIYYRYLHLMLSVCKCISWSIDDGNFKSLLRSKFKTCEKD